MMMVFDKQMNLQYPSSFSLITHAMASIETVVPANGIFHLNPTLQRRQHSLLPHLSNSSLGIHGVRWAERTDKIEAIGWHAMYKMEV